MVLEPVVAELVEASKPLITMFPSTGSGNALLHVSTTTFAQCTSGRRVQQKAQNPVLTSLLVLV